MILPSYARRGAGIQQGRRGPSPGAETQVVEGGIYPARDFSPALRGINRLARVFLESPAADVHVGQRVLEDPRRPGGPPHTHGFFKYLSNQVISSHNTCSMDSRPPYPCDSSGSITSRTVPPLPRIA